MKVKQICMMVLLWLGVIPAVQAQTFDKLWKEVEQAEKKSLPKTVIKLTDEIYQKGEKEKNSPQMLKANSRLGLFTAAGLRSPSKWVHVRAGAPSPEVTGPFCRVP